MPLGAFADMTCNLHVLNLLGISMHKANFLGLPIYVLLIIIKPIGYGHFCF